VNFRFDNERTAPRAWSPANAADDVAAMAAVAPTTDNDDEETRHNRMHTNTTCTTHDEAMVAIGRELLRDAEEEELVEEMPRDADGLDDGDGFFLSDTSIGPATVAETRQASDQRASALRRDLVSATTAAAMAAAELTQRLEAEQRRAADAARAANDRFAKADQELEAERRQRLALETTNARMLAMLEMLERRVEAEKGRAKTLAAELAELRQQQTAVAAAAGASLWNTAGGALPAGGGGHTEDTEDDAPCPPCPPRRWPAPCPPCPQDGATVAERTELVRGARRPASARMVQRSWCARRLTARGPSQAAVSQTTELHASNSSDSGSVDILVLVTTAPISHSA
jgi:hypothetical protein